MHGSSVFYFIFGILFIRKLYMKNFICLNTGITFVFIAVFVSMLGGCKHKTNFDELTEVSYSSSVAPIINSNCAFSGCHGDSLSGSMNLVHYDGLMNGGIEAGSPNKSKLYLALKSLKDDVMPKKPYNELTEKQIQLIYVWIGQGAKNN